MSVTKDGTTGRWMSQIRVTDWTGNVIHKKKRGFATKKEALKWEQEIIAQANGSVGMTFGRFVEIYFNDLKERLKETTLQGKHWMIDTKITPYFKSLQLNEIKPTDIRKWQNIMTSYRDENGKPYAATYIRTVYNQLTAIFNYAVKYYGLKENPCHKAGGVGKKKADEMQFWTKEEFNTFIEAVKDNVAVYTIFMTLYYSGIREGELLALTPADIDLEKKTLSVNKNYQVVSNREIITSPKTPKSNRVIPIPDKLCECLDLYMGLSYGLKPTDRLFPYRKEFLYKALNKGCKKSGVKKIRIHDIRHSHASLLVELGFSPLLIAERLGHEKVQTTMDTYSHLYPNKQVEVANQLNGLIP